MPEIYDNIQQRLDSALKETLAESIRADFCLGYFNLRGWKVIAESIDTLVGGEVVGEKKAGAHHRICRLIVGMYQSPQELLRDYFFRYPDYVLDKEEAIRIKLKLAEEFRAQLALGYPNGGDEIALRNLARQLKEGKVIVRLHLEFKIE